MFFLKKKKYLKSLKPKIWELGKIKLLICSCIIIYAKQWTQGARINQPGFGGRVFWTLNNTVLSSRTRGTQPGGRGLIRVKRDWGNKGCGIAKVRDLTPPKTQNSTFSAAASVIADAALKLSLCY